VALARAIANEPAVLLLDEPLSNLDAKLREEMRQQIKDLARRLETTTLYVTHDQLEALSMSDTVALMRDGVMVQEGAPRDVYLRPADSFAANFLGRTNLLDGRVIEGAPGGIGTIDTQWGQLRCVLPAGVSAGAELTVGFRPESVHLATAPLAGTPGLEGTIAATSFAGDAVEYQIELGDRRILAKAQPFEVLNDGQRVFIVVPPERCYVLDSLSAGAAV
jgi:iron(III) transport system ATP-binding protein